MDIKVEYNGAYPNLCRGDLFVIIDSVRWKFPDCALSSGGEICRNEDWDMWAVSGPWSIEEWPEEFPEDEYLRLNVVEAVNSNICWGCCGGCI